MKIGIWEKIFSDNLFEGIRPNKAQRKILYDRCFRRVRREFKKQGRKPSKEELDEALYDCLTQEVYEFQFQNEKPRKFVDTDFDTGEINREREERELAEDIRRLGNINRNFWEGERKDSEKKREEQNKRLKREIEERIRSESGYYS